MIQIPMDGSSVDMTCGEQEEAWLEKINKSDTRKILHFTTFESAMSIIHNKKIRGAIGKYDFRGAYPHFTMCGWPNSNQTNGHPDVKLVFETKLKARKIPNEAMPDAHWLEVEFSNGNPTECMVHPCSPALELIEIRAGNPKINYWPFPRALFGSIIFYCNWRLKTYFAIRRKIKINAHVERIEISSVEAYYMKANHTDL